MTKRAFDAVASGLGLVVLSPLLALAALAVAIDSGRPVIFSHERVGRDGRPFRIYKFRSMEEVSGSVPLITAAIDARISRVGAKLRATKVDELPQLWNVFRGDMSLVGPRPEVPKYVALWPAEDREVILSVRPGLTDPATKKYRREERLLASQSNPETYYREVVLPDKVRMYREYVENRSGMTDLRLLAGTLLTVAAE